MENIYYQPEIQEVQYIIDEQIQPTIEVEMTWVETWDSEYTDIAQSVWDEFVENPELLTQDDYEQLDDIVFNRIELYTLDN